jgi:hypothetical protein
MRRVMVSCVILLMLVALSPLAATAKNPSSGGKSGGVQQSGSQQSGMQQGFGQKSGWQQGGVSHDDWRWRNGSWYWGTDYRYPVTPYVVERPIIVNPLPDAQFSGGPIKITNPATNKVTLSYTLNGVTYTIPPGYTQDLREDRPWVIDFSRGANFGQGRYSLESGLYSFSLSASGWELYRRPLEQAVAAPLPPTPPPAMSAQPIQQR